MDVAIDCRAFGPKAGRPAEWLRSNRRICYTNFRVRTLDAELNEGAGEAAEFKHRLFVRKQMGQLRAAPLSFRNSVIA